MSLDAKTAILDRIGKALRDIPRDEQPDDVALARTYRTSESASQAERINLFAERVADYRATVHRVVAEDLPAAIQAACDRRGVKNLVVPLDVPSEWIGDEITALRDESLTNEQLNASDGVLTGCALGIAQTGTIVLDGGPLQGRRVLTLLPDYHLCVIRAEQVVGLVPEAVTLLQDSARIPGRPMTWISGPSATSDIELNRVEGVHGPRTLEVLIVG